MKRKTNITPRSSQINLRLSSLSHKFKQHSADCHGVTYRFSYLLTQITKKMGPKVPKFRLAVVPLLPIGMTTAQRQDPCWRQVAQGWGFSSLVRCSDVLHPENRRHWSQYFIITHMTNAAVVNIAKILFLCHQCQDFQEDSGSLEIFLTFHCRSFTLRLRAARGIDNRSGKCKYTPF